jgi:amino acid transporter
MEEKSPGTSLKRVGLVLVACIGLAILFYCLVILSASMTLPWENLLSFELPAAGAFGSLSNTPALRTLVLVAGLVGILSTWNAIFLAGSRVLFALGRAHMILPAFGTTHSRFHTPAVAVFFVALVGSLGIFLGRRAIFLVVNVAATCLAFAFFITCLGLIRLRRLRPHEPRPYRTPGGILTAALAAVLCLFMVLSSLYQHYTSAQGSFPLEWIILLVWMVLGILFWTGSNRLRRQVSEAERRKLILGGG